MAQESTAGIKAVALYVLVFPWYLYRHQRSKRRLPLPFRTTEGRSDRQTVRPSGRSRAEVVGGLSIVDCGTALSRVGALTRLRAGDPSARQKCMWSREMRWELNGLAVTPDVVL